MDRQADRLTTNRPPGAHPGHNFTALTAMTPTVDDILSRTAIGCGWHDFHADGGAVRMRTADLRAALEDAYDADMPNWPAMVDLD